MDFSWYVFYAIALFIVHNYLFLANHFAIWQPWQKLNVTIISKHEIRIYAAISLALSWETTDAPNKLMNTELFDRTERNSPKY